MKKLSAAEQRFKDYLLANNIQPFSAVTEEEIQHEAKLFQEWAGEPALPFKELHIKARDGFPVRIRVFNPEARGQTLFYLPGNGYLVKHLFEANTVAASRIAKASQQRVVIIEFRLMPTYPWPTSINDVQDVMNACIHHHAIPEVDSAQISLSGMSSGAHASVMLALNSNRGFNIQRLMLIGGSYDWTFRQDQFREDEKLDYICKRENLYELKNSWGLGDKNMTSPEYSPLFAEDFKSLPETFIIVGEFDGVRADSEALYLKLKDQGVKANKIILPGQTHNNILFYRASGEEDDAALICARLLAE